MAFTPVMVTADFDLANGLDPEGEVRFTPTEPMVNGTTVVEAPVAQLLNADGLLSIRLDANTDPATTPADTSYLVVESIAGVERSYYTQIPHDQGPTVDLSTLPKAPVDTELPTLPPTVTEVVVTYPVPGPPGPQGPPGSGSDPNRAAALALIFGTGG